MERVVVGTKKIIEYQGKCPDCGKEQIHFNPEYVDVPCWMCSKKKKEEQIRKKYEHLINGTVVTVYGYNNLTCIRIKAPNGKEYDITSRREFGEENEYLNVKSAVQHKSEENNVNES